MKPAGSREEHGVEARTDEASAEFRESPSGVKAKASWKSEPRVPESRSGRQRARVFHKEARIEAATVNAMKGSDIQIGTFSSKMPV
jgi:hypothetical protein